MTDTLLPIVMLAGFAAMAYLLRQQQATLLRVLDRPLTVQVAAPAVTITPPEVHVAASPAPVVHVPKFEMPAAEIQVLEAPAPSWVAALPSWLEAVTQTLSALPDRLTPPPAAPSESPASSAGCVLAPRSSRTARVICLDRKREHPRLVTVEDPRHRVLLPGGEYHRVGTHDGTPVYALLHGHHQTATRGGQKVVLH